MNGTILPALTTWSPKRLRRALAQVSELIAAAGDYLPADDWRIIHRDELLLALSAQREGRADGTILPALTTWSRKRLLRALAQTNELIAAAGDYLPADDWRIIHRDELLLALSAQREGRAA